MKQNVALLAAALALVSCSGVHVVDPQKLQMQAVNLPMRTFNFASGLRVVVERDPRTPLAGVFVVVGSGSSNDPEGKEGLAHYVEHLAFRARPFGTDSYSDMFAAAGAVYQNAVTETDATTYYELGPASALPQLLRAEAVRMAVPVANIPDDAFAVELAIVRNELREHNETGFVGDVLSRLQTALFPAGHPNAIPVGGTHQSLSALTKADVEAFAKENYKPANMTMVILGNVDLDKAEALLADTLPQALADSPTPVRLGLRLPPSAPAVPPPPPQTSALPKYDATIASPELWVAWAMPRAYDRDGYLLDFLASALEDRLGRIRTGNPDVTAIDVYPLPGKDASMLLCRISLQDGTGPDKVLKDVLDEAPKAINSFSVNTSYFEEYAYARMRRFMIVSEIAQLENLVGRGLHRATVTHFSQDPLLLSKMLHDISEVKPQRIHEYGAPYLTKERARAALFVPNGRGVQQLAAAGEATPARGGNVDRKGDKLVVPPPALARELLVNPGQLSSEKLPNGISVYYVRRPGLPLVSASLALNITPAEAKNPGVRALAWAMSRPETSYNSPFDYGGLVRTHLEADSWTTRVEASSGNAEAIVATVAEHVRTLRVNRFADNHFREAVIPMSKRRERDPHRVADRKFLAALLPETPYAKIAEASEIEKASSDDANDWIDEIRAPQNATLIVSGDFDPALMHKYVSDAFANWKMAAPPRATVVPATQRSPRATPYFELTPRPGASQAEVRFGCQLPAITSGSLALRHDLGARVLQARMEKILRERLGATYGVSSRVVEYVDGTSFLDVQTNVENAQLAAALRELEHGLTELSHVPVDGLTLSWARYNKAASVALSQMSNDAVTASIFQRTQRGLPPDLSQLAQELDGVTAADVQSDFKACLAGHPTISIVGEERVISSANAAWSAH